MSKFDYVRSEAAKHDSHSTDDFARHTCHWPGCERRVPPAMWGCKSHWFKLPMRLRNRIWATYRPGQEISKTPSAEYLAVAQDVQEWIASGMSAFGQDAKRLEVEPASPTAAGGDAQQQDTP